MGSSRAEALDQGWVEKVPKDGAALVDTSSESLWAGMVRQASRAPARAMAATAGRDDSLDIATSRRRLARMSTLLGYEAAAAATRPATASLGSFRLVDRDASGLVDAAELRSFLVDRGLSDAAAMRLFERLDRDSSGELDMLEFASHPEFGSGHESLRRADVNQDGIVSQEELRALFARAGLLLEVADRVFLNLRTRRGPETGFGDIVLDKHHHASKEDGERRAAPAAAANIDEVKQLIRQKNLMFFSRESRHGKRHSAGLYADYEDDYGQRL